MLRTGMVGGAAMSGVIQKLSVGCHAAFDQVIRGACYSLRGHGVEEDVAELLTSQGTQEDPQTDCEQIVNRSWWLSSSSLSSLLLLLSLSLLSFFQTVLVPNMRLYKSFRLNRSFDCPSVTSLLFCVLTHFKNRKIGTDGWTDRHSDLKSCMHATYSDRPCLFLIT